MLRGGSLCGGRLYLGVSAPARLILLPVAHSSTASRSVETDQSSARQMAILKLIHDAGDYLRTLEQIDTVRLCADICLERECVWVCVCEMMKRVPTSMTRAPGVDLLLPQT
jgi:hypothetical protein